jgi:hypothetical protein
VKRLNPSVRPMALLIALACSACAPLASVSPSQVGSASPLPSPTLTVAASPSPAAVGLEGWWSTGPISSDQMAAALRRAGLDASLLEEMYPPDQVARAVVFELQVTATRWTEYEYVNGGPRATGWSGSYYRNPADATVIATDSANSACRFTYRPQLDGDVLAIDLVSGTCDGDMPFQTVIYKSEPFHRIASSAGLDLSGIVLTEPLTGSSIPTLGPSTSSQRFALREFGTVAGAPMPYAEYLPPGYGDGLRHPLLVALPGSDGQTMPNLKEALDHILGGGLPGTIARDRWPDDRDMIVLMPARIDRPPDYCISSAEIDGFLRFAMAHYAVNPARVYLTGLSCGATGGWSYLAEHGNELVAAAVLIAGDGTSAFATAACQLGRVPVWAIVGANDDAFLSGSVYTIRSLQHCTDPRAVDVRLTIFDAVSHEAWDRTYEMWGGIDIYSWLLGHENPTR